MMVSSFESVANLLKLHDRVFNRVTEGLTEEQARKRPADTGNSPYFVVGHVVTSRYSIAQLLGVGEVHKWGEMFDRGSQVPADGEGPSLDELIAAWKEVTVKLLEKIDDVSEETLNAEGSMEVPPFPKTRGGLATFLTFHEAYHLGQLGYVRRFCGLDQAFG